MAVQVLGEKERYFPFLMSLNGPEQTEEDTDQLPMSGECKFSAYLAFY